MKTLKNRKELEALIKKLPKDFSQHCVRDMSLLSCYVFGKTHMADIPKKFGIRFSSFSFYNKNGLITLFRPQSEYDAFSRSIGKRAKKDALFAEKISDRLRELTDWFTIAISKKRFQKDEFIKKYTEFFSYRQAVYWGGDYLSKIDYDDSKKVVDMLDSAYRYNEMIFPNIERYFKKSGIGHLLPSEIGKKTMPDKERGLLFIGKEIYQLEHEQSLYLYNKIKAKNSSRNWVKGISAFPGKCRGKARLILDLNNLHLVKKGDILVTSMTRPQFNRQIKNAKAIVTDEGGMLCHASILAREAGIPSVVGTKTATKVLKDGDLIEVNADKGIIKILERR